MRSRAGVKRGQRDERVARYGICNCAEVDSVAEA